jgi:ABC-type multidrug transport system ATPase subunit
MNALYSLRNLRRRFGERTVLDIDALDIEAGELYALLGDNGAGKSTLMRILACLDAPSGGVMLFRGARVLPGREARFRPGVVWVPQFPVMFTGTVLYNVEYPMALKKTPPDGRRRRALELLESVGLGHLAYAPAHKLSGGECQRATIARALAADAHTILFDEPTTNLDRYAFEDCIALVRNLWQERKLSIVIITHNAALAATLCRRQIFLSRGRLVRQHVLPGGAIAWPARLAPNTPDPDGGTGGVTLSIAPAALPEDTAFPLPAIVKGIEDLAAGVVLRLDSPAGRRLDVLLDKACDQDAARALTLGSALTLERNAP